MNKWIFMVLFLLFFAGVPVYLAEIQDVPTRFAFQHAVLLTSLAAFGLMLGLFWLSRLMPKDAVKMKYAATMRWHKYIGYVAGLFMLVHPVLMIARRFTAVESNPVGNLILMIKSPLMLTGVIAWCLLVALILVAFFRKPMPAKIFRYVHGVMAIGFTGLSTWHVVSVGRHSNPAMSGFWIVLAVGAVGALLWSYKPARRKTDNPIYQGAANESA
ncbi:ferric reductase-like transmembrane domain-containing protein [Pontiellaceae bacterium B12227]|nr:ferric reductase-like transmembrane domain-containing protein [Pontiellaceae bacterium B12227]